MGCGSETSFNFFQSCNTGFVWRVYWVTHDISLEGSWELKIIHFLFLAWQLISATIASDSLPHDTRPLQGVQLQGIRCESGSLLAHRSAPMGGSSLCSKWGWTWCRNKGIPCFLLRTHLPGTGTAPTGSFPGWGTGLQSRSHLLPPGILAAPGTGLGSAQIPAGAQCQRQKGTGSDRDGWPPARSFIHSPTIRPRNICKHPQKTRQWPRY